MRLSGTLLSTLSPPCDPPVTPLSPPCPPLSPACHRQPSPQDFIRQTYTKAALSVLCMSCASCKFSIGVGLSFPCLLCGLSTDACVVLLGICRDGSSVRQPGSAYCYYVLSIAYCVSASMSIVQDYVAIGFIVTTCDRLADDVLLLLCCLANFAYEGCLQSQACSIMACSFAPG